MAQRAVLQCFAEILQRFKNRYAGTQQVLKMKTEIEQFASAQVATAWGLLPEGLACAEQLQPLGPQVFLQACRVSGV